MTEISLDRSALLYAVRRARSTIQGSATLPILSNLRLTSDGATLEVAGTDLATEVRVTVPLIGGSEACAATVPAQKLAGILAAMKEGPLRLSITDARCTVIAGTGRFVLQTLPATDWPAMAEPPRSAERVAIDPELLRALLEPAYAAARDDVRYYLCGLHWSSAESGTYSEASDGKRASRRLIRGANLPGSRILTVDSVKHLGTLTKDASDQVQLELWDNGLRAESGNTALTCKLIDGRYPDLERVFPRKYVGATVFSAEEAICALKRCEPLANSAYKTCVLTIEQDEILISTATESESSTERIEATTNGEPIIIGANINILIDAIASLKSERASIEYAAPDSGIVIHADGGLRSESAELVMPVRL